MNGGRIPWGVTVICETFKISCLLGRHPYERRIGVPFNGPVIPFGAMAEFHPISDKDLSATTSIWVKSLARCSPRFNQESVSSDAFMVQSGICLKRAEPVNTVCVMVVFPSLGNELQMRSFLESLDSEHSSSATSVKVKVPAMLIDGYIVRRVSSYVDSHVVEEHTGRCRCKGPWRCWTELRNS